MFSSILEVTVLVIALSVDAFAASFVYGADRVKIPPASLAIIAGLSTGILVLFLYIGGCLGALISPAVTRILCFSILFLLGIAKLFDSSIKALIRTHRNLAKKLCFSFAGLQFILTIYADPQTANGEDISVLSPLEALSLGIALSLDSAAAGFGAGMMAFHLPLTILLSLFSNAAAVLAGSLLGRKLASRSSRDLSFVSGIMLMILAVIKLI